MFYLLFENQLQLVLLVVFSSYVFASAIAISVNDPRLKAMGLSFIIPLLLGCYSFFSAPYNTGAASAYLDLSWFLLVLLLATISFVQKPFRALKYLDVAIFMLPVGAILMKNTLLGLDLRLYVRFANLVLAASQMIMTVACLICKNRDRALLHSGILLASLGFAMFISDRLDPMLAVLPAASGLFICAFYFYAHTYGRLKHEHRRFSQELDKSNHSLHVEVTGRVRKMEADKVPEENQGPIQ